MSSSAARKPVQQRQRRGSTSVSVSGAERTRDRRQNRTLTCANCRTRKTRCDGSQPGCKTCEVYHDECRYEKPPPMSQIIAMAKRLQEAEEIIANFKKDGLESSQVSSDSVLDSLTRSSRCSTPRPAGGEHNDGFGDEIDVPKAMSEKQPNGDPSLSDLSLDEHGKASLLEICYYGPTSAVHEPPKSESHLSPGVDSHNQQSKIEIQSMLTSNARDLRAWEDFALGNLAFQSDLPRETISQLLQIHWTWISPMFMWVYRPAFMRDMTTDGPYFSQFLLIVLCAHAARFHDRQVGDMLISRARLLLGTEIHRPSSIPTVQALLQLSARDLAFGSISQAWLYSGMAFRMVSDLGLHQSTAKMVELGHLSSEDLEIRRRAISLYLGRMPALTELPFDPAPELMDQFSEHEQWNPCYGESGNLSEIPGGSYPPMESHAVSCFENSCKLAVILNDIILQLYSRRAPTQISLRSIRDKLNSWRAKSPRHLVYDPDALPEISPPPHILTQNLLFYTTMILLHRPFYSSAVHHTACRNAADNVEKLLLLLEKTFGFHRITYLMAYCIYTAASVITQDLKAGDLEATAKMKTFDRALKGGCATCPVVQRSIDIINNSLQHSTIRPGPESGSQDVGFARNYLPAFPYSDNFPDFPGYTAFSNSDLDATLLECFPENHIDINLANEWEWPMNQIL
ncbi:related to pathway-specific regulatory protein [Phialocephala subalpina]|uniref:Related to pathway-specific regulatory protein n=1 Tax=Phialocephala subalpina TaxID=576137 RepID=A0A1L7XY07_9HELO|nr:related to pathway-specific regulatory protein [Phialocephala subalpina]